MTTNNAVNVGLSGSTGTGNFVGATSPTLVTPTLGVATATSLQLGANGILDTNGNEMASLSATSTAVNYFQLKNAATGSGPTLTATGTDTNIVFNLATTGNGGVNIQGTTAGGNAPSGNIGEYQTGTASGVSLSSGSPATVVTLSLTAGDWDVWGNLEFVPAGSTTVSAIAGCVSTATNTIQTNLSLVSYQAPLTTGNTQYICPGIFRFNISTTTNIYLVAQSSFAVSTMTATGIIGARRVR